MSEVEIDMADLIDRDPLSLTDQDLEVIIGKLRKQRGAWNLGNASAGRAKPTKATKAFTALPSIGIDI